MDSRKAAGQIKKGEVRNPFGRPARPEIQELREALEKARKNHDKSFLEHFVEKAYQDNNVAIALAKKILPDLTDMSADLRGRIILIRPPQDIQ